MSDTKRIIGVQHRTKWTAAGEARPTRVCIHDLTTGEKISYDLETETDELDFILGAWPTGYRAVEPDEDVKRFKKHHVQTKPVDGFEIPHRVPKNFEGIRSGDVVVMFLGGSGDRLAFATARNGQPLGVPVMRIPAFAANGNGEEAIDHEVRLVDLYRTSPEMFRPTTARDMDTMLIKELFLRRRDSQRARIGVEQRLRQRTIGNTFFTTEGGYPEGRIEDRFDAEKANDEKLTISLRDERQRDADLDKAVRKLEVWQKVFDPIEGCGVTIAAGIISGIGDVRRFLTVDELNELTVNRRRVIQLDAKSKRNEYAKRLEPVEGENHFQRSARIRQLMLSEGQIAAGQMIQETLQLMQRNTDIIRKATNRFKAFSGVHLINGWALCGDCGHHFDIEKHAEILGCPKCKSVNIAPKPLFPRRRVGVVANWHPVVRQSLYQLGEQFNKRPKSAWGMRLRQIKASLQAQHPEPIKLGNTTRYTKAHLHRIAIWRTLTRFAEELFRNWLRLELEAAVASEVVVNE